ERWEMSPSVVPTRDDLVARLRVRFADVPVENVRRCVDDLWCCCTHLGVRPEERAIERLAASRLTGVVRGGRPPYPDGRAGSMPPGSRATAERPAGARTPTGMGRTKDTAVPGLGTGTRRGFTVLRMPAQISWQNYAGIREEVSRALSPATGGRGGVILAFGDAVLLDAAGLVLLARAETRARLLGRTLRAVVPEESAHVRRALRLTGLSRLVPVFTDAASAAAEPVPPRAARDVDTAYALDAIR